MTTHDTSKAMVARNDADYKDFSHGQAVLDLESTVACLVEEAFANGECAGNGATGFRTTYSDGGSVSTAVVHNSFKATLEWSGETQDHPVLVLREFEPLMIESATVEVTIRGIGRLLRKDRSNEDESPVEPTQYSGNYELVVRIQATGRCFPLGYETSGKFECMLTGTRHCVVTFK